MMKGVMDQQISYLTVIVVHLTMHLMLHNHCIYVAPDTMQLVGLTIITRCNAR